MVVDLFRINRLVRSFGIDRSDQIDQLKRIHSCSEEVIVRLKVSDIEGASNGLRKSRLCCLYIVKIQILFTLRPFGSNRVQVLVDFVDLGGVELVSCGTLNGPFTGARERFVWRSEKDEISSYLSVFSS